MPQLERGDAADRAVLPNCVYSGGRNSPTAGTFVTRLFHVSTMRQALYGLHDEMQAPGPARLPTAPGGVELAGQVAGGAGLLGRFQRSNQSTEHQQVTVLPRQ